MAHRGGSFFLVFVVRLFLGLLSRLPGRGPPVPGSRLPGGRFDGLRRYDFLSRGRGGGHLAAPGTLNTLAGQVVLDAEALATGAGYNEGHCYSPGGEPLGGSAVRRNRT